VAKFTGWVVGTASAAVEMVHLDRSAPE
jgi:hypothetical protein